MSLTLIITGSPFCQVRKVWLGLGEERAKTSLEDHYSACQKGLGHWNQGSQVTVTDIAVESVHLSKK